MGAQLIQPVRELVFTSPEESILITLSGGRLIELFGDGVIHEAIPEGIGILQSEL